VVQWTKEHQGVLKQQRPRFLQAPFIDQSFPWVFFDGASQGTPALARAEAVIHLSPAHKLHIKFPPGSGTNNKA